MSAQLDKSLDDIIKAQSSGQRRKNRNQQKVKPSAIVKPVAKTVKKPAAAVGKNANKKSAKVSAITTALSDATQFADRVIISNLPHDVTEKNVRDYFAQSIGPISKSEASYNLKGKFSGSVSLTFKRPGDASRAVEKYNGRPIDGGALYMKLELVVDPSKKPLGARLGEAAPQKTNKQPAKPVKAPTKEAPKKKKAQAAKKARKPLKTLEQLDADMADYFDAPAAAPVTNPASTTMAS